MVNELTFHSEAGIQMLLRLHVPLQVPRVHPLQLDIVSVSLLVVLLEVGVVGGHRVADLIVRALLVRGVVRAGIRTLTHLGLGHGARVGLVLFDLFISEVLLLSACSGLAHASKYAGRLEGLI